MGKCIEQILLKEEAQMTSKYMKEMFTIGERQIKMTLRPHFKPIRVTNIKKKKQILVSVRESRMTVTKKIQIFMCGKQEPLYTISYSTCCGSEYGGSSKN